MAGSGSVGTANANVSRLTQSASCFNPDPQAKRTIWRTTMKGARLLSMIERQNGLGPDEVAEGWPFRIGSSEGHPVNQCYTLPPKGSQIFWGYIARESHGEASS